MAISRFLKTRWPWLLLIVIPLWLAGAIMDLRDARTLEKEGVAVTGSVESARWIKGRRGRKLLECTVTWQHHDQKLSRAFQIPEKHAPDYADDAGNLRQTRIELRCADSRPELAALVIAPPDPWWVSLIIACVGFILLVAVVAFLIHDWRSKIRGKSGAR